MRSREEIQASLTGKVNKWHGDDLNLLLATEVIDILLDIRDILSSKEKEV